MNSQQKEILHLMDKYRQNVNKIDNLIQLMELDHDHTTGECALCNSSAGEVEKLSAINRSILENIFYNVNAPLV